ncbi:MAG: DUF2076 domain-containing protein, partial [Hyphomicrobiales bacterium]
MNSDDRRAIEGLFDRVADVERQNPHRDPDAERLIEDSIRRQPNAPYYLAQTVVVQQQALEMAERRIQELEGQGRGRDVTDERRRDAPRGPWERNNDQRGDRTDRRGGFGGGGFLAGAAQTAMGVAGGMLLGNMIGGLFGAGSANAAESGSGDQEDADVGNDAGND